ncbi:MAG: sigma-70 family RNA polymerase sigma factor [Victivallales bacterium]|nr:sigma-70 family RNA polymerase sigma factor [Victivallales bacterium]
MPEKDTLQIIIDENQASLLRYAERLLNDRILAQDAVQSTFLKYLRNNPETVRNHRAWLFKILRNHCFNILQAKKNKPEFMLDENIKSLSHTASPDRELMNSETAQILRRSINALKPRHKEIIILKLEHGKTYKEIARILDLSVSNVGFILHSAMNELKNDLREILSK